MAECYSTLGYNGDLAPEIAFPKARAAATRALELDSTLADAHRALAYQLLFGEWDFVGADREYARAVALDPSDAVRTLAARHVPGRDEPQLARR